jgi:citronellol/citronellal dehydrogenase
VDTDAIGLIAGPDARKRCRTPQILADAAHYILTRPSRQFTGNFCIDDVVLRDAGVTDFSRYRHAGVKEADLMPDFFV